MHWLTHTQIDHPQHEKQVWHSCVSIQRKRAVIACFRQTSLHMMPRYLSCCNDAPLTPMSLSSVMIFSFSLPLFQTRLQSGPIACLFYTLQELREISYELPLCGYPLLKLYFMFSIQNTSDGSGPSFGRFYR